MAKLSDLLAQQEKLKQQIIEASQEEIEEINERLDAISQATGRSISDLLGLRNSIPAKTTKTDKDKDKDQKYRDWLMKSKDETHKIGGRDMVITDKTRLTQNVRDYVDSLGA